MMRSMFAGVSGLKAHQTRMDVIGNNIANVNSAGYKSSRVTFQDMLSQTIRSATAPSSNRGGTNPQQVGLGVSLGSIDVKHTQGNTQSTGYGTDLAIEGDGFFILGEGENRKYTRAGMFGLDDGTEGNLVSLVNGERVLGYKADRNGVIDPNSSLVPLYISASETISPRATTTVNFAGNLDNRYELDREVDRTIQVYDSRGREQTINVNLKQLGDNKWRWDAHWLLISDSISMFNTNLENNEDYVVIGDEIVLAADPTVKIATTSGSASEHGRIWQLLDADGNPTDTRFEFETALEPNDKLKSSGAEGIVFLTHEREIRPTEAADGTLFDESDYEIIFNGDGSFNGLGNAETALITLDIVNADDLKFTLDFSEFTQYADTFTGKFMHQDGYTNGALESYAIDQNGTIVGSFSNGLTRNLGQIALARFANAAGLERAGSTMFVDTPNSGIAQIGVAGAPGFGAIAPSSLEMSNVDLSEEFTEMIITQRGFQANSRIITSSDEMLQELVNLKR